MNLKIVCLALGLLAGGLVGWMTRPDTAAIRLPGIEIKVEEGAGGGLSSDQTRHVGLSALVGAIIGLGVGFIADRRR